MIRIHSLISRIGVRTPLLKAGLLAGIALGVLVAAPQNAWAGFGVVPHVDCVTFDEFSNQIVVYWGYTNTNPFEITIDNSFNFFVPGPSNRDQPITFAAGRHDYAFTTISDASTSATWVLGEFFSTASNDPNQYCVTPTAVGEPSIVADGVTVQSGAPPSVLNLATVTSPVIPLGQLSVQVYTDFSSAFSVANPSLGANGTITGAVQASGPPGQYQALLLVTTGEGLDAAATVTVTVTAACSPPIITAQPVAQFSSGGASVSFTAEASGSPTPSVQWQVSTDGGSTFTNIAGATATTLHVPYSALIAGYIYRAVFTSSCGSATTTSASLPEFNNCLQSDTSGDHIQFNSATGDYVFTHCGNPGFTLAGKGSVTSSNGTVTITDKEADRVVKITFLQGQLTGGARITAISSAGVSTTYVINDTNPAATCGCQ